MVISSVGYPGTVDAVQWAQMAFRIGSARYGVDSYASWRVQTTAGTRAIQISAGSGWGYGVRDISDSPETINLNSVPTGTRWDLVVARRNWGIGESAFAIVEGGSSRAIPTREQTPGVLDEQPLALVRVNAGSSVVGEIVDLRVLCDFGGIFAFDDLALSYLGYIGADVLIGTRTWRRVVSATGASVWASIDTGDTGVVTEGLTFELGGGFEMVNYALRRINGIISGRARVRYTRDATMAADGSFSSRSVLRLPTGFAPFTTQSVEMRGASTDAAFFPTISPTRLVTLQRGIPGNPLSNGGQYDLFFNYAGS